MSFSIEAGEVLGVVGESGAGKSLTGAAIIGLLEPPGRVAAGEILLGGRRIDNLPDEQMRRVRGREIGAVFQDPLTSLNPLYRGPAAGRDHRHAPGPELVAGAHAGGRTAGGHRHPGGARAHRPLSAPVLRRHAPARGDRAGLAAEPRLVVADEPTTALDVSIQAQIIELLKRLCREQGTAVMLITTTWA